MAAAECVRRLGRWQCSDCDTWNGMRDVRCLACGTARGSSGAPEPTEKAKQLLAEAAVDYANSGELRRRIDERARRNHVLYGGGQS